MALEAFSLDESDLRVAFEEGRFGLHYQPQFSSRDRALVGVEALARLQARDGTIVSPASFMETVERSGLIEDLGIFLFKVACRDSAAWPSISVAVNVSPAQFRDPLLSKRLIEIARKADVEPSRIEIEITEGLFFADPVAAESALKSLSAAGFSIALDDFGTGYSSLGYLLRFPVHKIKIDKSFIDDVPRDLKSASIVHAVIALARAIGLRVVAEGVEREEQFAFLRSAGCHIIQGYLLGRPVSASEISSAFSHRDA